MKSKGIATSVLVLAIFSLTGCAIPRPRDACRFLYDQDVQERITIPLLDKQFGQGVHLYFNYDQPGIVEHRQRVELVFSPVRYVGGRRLVDETSFVIVLDRCSHRVLDSYTVR
ncbi:MAG: hypothetical protein JSR60_05165 [Proteobacteria bacterium]|nr:hypothetical protein [Pseudomonadota bacterium]